MAIHIPALTALQAQAVTMRQASDVIDVPTDVLEAAEAVVARLTKLADAADENLHASQIDGWGDDAAAKLAQGKLAWLDLLQLCAASEGIGVARAESIVARTGEMIAAEFNPREHDWLGAFRDAAEPLAKELEAITESVERSGDSIQAHSTNAAADQRYHRGRQWVYRWVGLQDHAERFREAKLLDAAPHENRRMFEWEHPELVPPVQHPDDLVESYVIGCARGANLGYYGPADIRRRRRAS